MAVGQARKNPSKLPGKKQTNKHKQTNTEGIDVLVRGAESKRTSSWVTTLMVTARNGEFQMHFRTKRKKGRRGKRKGGGGGGGGRINKN